ncbi:MAG: dockerin type I repeat-containing protein [Ruminococcus sp.]|nr:dockerin type I repeat-containing protein [Ruminococcus sp.]
MKKLFSILLVVVMMASVCCVSVFAENNDIQNEFLYQDKFEEFIKLPERTDSLVEDMETYYYDYDELYYHKNADSGEVDWVLARAYTNAPPPPWMMIYVKQIGNRVIKSISPGIVTLPYAYAIYNATDDCYYDISDINPDDYKGLAEAFEELEIGHAIDDVDVDGSVSIMDATTIQIYLAKEEEIEDIYDKYYTTLADLDGDGEMSIMDATEIQLKLAGLDKPAVNEEMVYSEFNNMYGVDTGIEEVSFETLYNSYYDVESKINGERYAVIIKSKEQLDSAFYSYVDLESVLNDEFFEDKWLVVSACRVTDSEMVAEISDLGVRYKTLFMRADRELNDTDGIAEPIAPMYYSFVAVDKDALAQVTEIIWL